MPSEYPGLEAKLNQLIQQDLAPVIRKWKNKFQGELGFTVFCFHFGPGGGIAYLSTAVRADSIRSTIEWLKNEGTREFPDLKPVFEVLYAGTRTPEDEGYDPEMVKKIADLFKNILPS